MFRSLSYTMFALYDVYYIISIDICNLFNCFIGVILSVLTVTLLFCFVNLSFVSCIQVVPLLNCSFELVFCFFWIVLSVQIVTFWYCFLEFALCVHFSCFVPILLFSITYFTGVVIIFPRINILF